MPKNLDCDSPRAKALAKRGSTELGVKKSTVLGRRQLLPIGASVTDRYVADGVIHNAGYTGS